MTTFHASWTRQEVSILEELGHVVYLLYPHENGILKRLFGANILLRNISLFVRSIPMCFMSDIILSWFVFPTGFIAAFWGKLFRKPAILNAAGYDVAYVPALNYGSPYKWYYRPLVSWALKSATKVIAISKESAHSAEMWGANDASVIYEGIDVEKFQSFPGEKMKKPGEFVLLTVLGLEKAGVKRKNLMGLLEALPDVRDTFPNVKLMIVGKKGDAYASIERMINKLGINNSVIFKGFVSESGLIELYNLCDVFVFPSLYEGFPTVCAEAQACEKPVVTTNTTSMPEVIKNNETGFLVEPGNARELAAAITRLLSDSTLRKEFGESGRRRMAQLFSKKLRKEKLSELLTSLKPPKTIN